MKWELILQFSFESCFNAQRLILNVIKWKKTISYKIVAKIKCFLFFLKKLGKTFSIWKKFCFFQSLQKLGFKADLSWWLTFIFKNLRWFHFTFRFYDFLTSQPSNFPFTTFHIPINIFLPQHFRPLKISRMFWQSFAAAVINMLPTDCKDF